MAALRGQGSAGRCQLQSGAPNGDNVGRDIQLVCLLPEPGDILNSSQPEELAPALLRAGPVVRGARLLPTERLDLGNPEVGPVTSATSVYENL